MSPRHCQPEGAMLIKLSDKATAVFFFFFYLQRLNGLRPHLARCLHVWFPCAGYRVSVRRKVDTLCVTTALAVALLSVLE